MDCRNWKPVNYVSKTDQPNQAAGITLAEREGAENRLEGWKQVRKGAFDYLKRQKGGGGQNGKVQVQSS
jgi:hypothetical protein